MSWDWPPSYERRANRRAAMSGTKRSISLFAPMAALAGGYDRADIFARLMAIAELPIGMDIDVCYIDLFTWPGLVVRGVRFERRRACD
jgi:hypothetical protein